MWQPKPIMTSENISKCSGTKEFQHEPLLKTPTPLEINTCEDLAIQIVEKEFNEMVEVKLDLPSVDCCWGNGGEWFLELKNGELLRLPMELRSLCVLEVLMEAVSPWMLQWVDPFREQLGDISHGSEWGAKGLDSGLEHSWLLLVELEEDRRGEDQTEPLVVTPLAMVVPLESLSTVNQDIKVVPPPQPLDWVLQQLKAFGKVLGASIKGNEAEVLGPLMTIDARRRKDIGNSGQKKMHVLGKRGSRELKGLVSSVNYDGKSRALSVIP